MWHLLPHRMIQNNLKLTYLVMEAQTLPEAVADAMVERLFKDQHPSQIDDILYPGCGGGDLVTAVHRYCEQNPAASPPPGVVVDIDTADAEAISTQYDEVEPRSGDYLHEEFVVESRFDYILCDPPTRPWAALSDEQQSAYATNFGQLTVEDDEIDSHLLFVIQAIRDLSLGGRAVFVTPPSLLRSEAASTLREQHYYRIDAVEELDPESYEGLDVPRLLTTITEDASEWESTVTTYEPAEHEAELNDSIATIENPFTAGGLMTAEPTGFGIDQSISQVYLELMAADYDAAPIYEDETVATELRGYVSREHLRMTNTETLENQIQRITHEVSVDPTAGLDEVIHKLAGSRFVFVFSDGSIDGIITRFDLNRLPVYTHLYDCFSQFEIGLRDLLRSRLPDWQDQTDIQVPYRGQQNVVSDRLTCAELSTLVEIVRDVELRSKLPSKLKVELNDLVKLRNAVAHYNPIVHTMTERPTLNKPERGAPQLAIEYEYLHTCIDTIETRVS